MFSIVVTREELNIYLDAFMSFCPEGREGARNSLVELIEASDNLEEAIASWLWWCGCGLEAALRVKIWFGLAYKDLGEVFALDFRDLKKLLRAQRAEFLGPYPPLDIQQDGAVGRTTEFTSCFMVEQNLSAWVDAEWEDFSQVENIRLHLDECSNCQDRLAKYRQLQTEIARQRKTAPPVSEQEWDEALVDARSLGRKRLLRGFAILFVLISLVGAGGFFVMKKEEKMPNIYEWKPN